MCRPIGYVLIVFLFLFTGRVTASSEVFEARYIDDGAGKRLLLSIEPVYRKLNLTALTSVLNYSESSFPASIIEHENPSREKIVILRSQSEDVIMTELRKRQVKDSEPLTIDESFLLAEDEVVTIVDSGPAKNRIDVVFMGDGYTVEEKQKFFSDMQRMVDDIFRDKTFRSYLPLFNIHLVFRASNESGIGKNNIAKDTAYGLYRAGNTLRAIYPSDKRALRNSCSKAPGCDYPVVIANDPYYGGLGGEFAISTSSVTSGTKVLRHELGHNFGRVGEEYDGGGYFGANYSKRLRNLSWKHWTTAKNVSSEPAKSRYIAWPWYNLIDGEYVAKFKSDGTASRASIRFSVSGMSEDSDLALTLDGSNVIYRGTGTDDRMFHNYRLNTGFSNGEHQLVFEGAMDGDDHWLSSVHIQEYGDDYHFDPDYIGAFPVFDPKGRVAGYRSNHETCLMRNMDSPVFCSICQENNWLQFFDNVELIDSVKTIYNQDIVTVTLYTLKIGQLYDQNNSGSITVQWFFNGEEISSFADKFQWTRSLDKAKGSWQVKVQFRSAEIRKDLNLFDDTKYIEI
ncbi:MAG: hypothetical protein CMP10_01695 [Zetaproteobacteria bacterium]|nr:hypothetical protein [Pseudobdellovibrionaceae bacterium]